MIDQKSFQKKILKWYQQFGRKSLPWQIDKTPYRVWISEIMLQQTQVSTVIPYFEKFMRSFPAIEDLAKAPLDRVLNHWSGLGYYARARNIHKCAKIITEEYQGKFPENLETLETLPGIGRSTAGAILSFGMNQKGIILDGNVKRVLCRCFLIEGWPGKTAVLQELWGITTKLTPSKHHANYNQAMMDIGALICTRTKPKCQDCPLCKTCKAHLSSTETNYPEKKPTKKQPVKKAKLILFRDKNKVLLIQRPPSGIWGGLWSFPECDQENISDWALETYGYQIKKRSALSPFTHIFSHFKLHIEPWLLDITPTDGLLKEAENVLWHIPTEPFPHGLPKPISQLLKKIT